MLHRKRNRVLSLAVLALGFFGTVPSWGAVTPGGDTIVGDASHSTTVGIAGTGTLLITGGSSLSDATSYLGFGAGSNGTGTVSGTGSKWATTASFFVGHAGSGTLRIETGGQVSSLFGIIGYSAGSVGAATVSGTGSMWTVSSSSLTVGDDGSGTLTIESGGQVSSKGGYVGNGATGTVAVNGGGSKWTSTAQMYVGYAASGTLSITGGGQVSNSIGYLGYVAGHAGTATVSGAGSTWANSNELYVGLDGAGTLTVSDGGLVTAKTLYASSSDLLGNGTITASDGAVLDADLVFDSTHSTTQALPFGSGGTLNLTVNGGQMGAGYKHSGSLRVADGAAIASSAGYLGYHSGSSGSATVSGAGSKWTNSGTLYVGNSGSGTLRIEAGGQVSNSAGYLGYSTGSAGTATVTGLGSTWANSGGLYVGNNGSTLTVSDGGLVTAKTIYASPGDLFGDGTITASGGAVLDADLVFDSTHGTTKTLSFGSGGTLNVTVNGGDLGAGYKGNGSLRIADAVTLTSSKGYLGYHTGSSGTATVSGTGSIWSNSGDLYIGRSGSGTLRIEAGGQVSSSSGTIGGSASGLVMVTGAGSKWTNSSNSLYVASHGRGTLAIEAGGQVSSTQTFVGSYAGSIGTILVSGAESALTNTSTLTVGSSGSGALTIEAGGRVSSSSGTLGRLPGSVGTVTVSGVGSTWTNSADLYVGREGRGTLTVADGALVTAETLYASASDLNGNGTITANGAVLDADLVFDASHGSAQAFGSGGTLNLTLTGTSILGVGYRGTGNLSIADGVAALSTKGYVGQGAGSSGTAMVSGAGSKWTNSSGLYVGQLGSGTLSIKAGGQVTNTVAYVGGESGSSGTVTVSGTESTWASSDFLFIGSYGAGALSIEAGGEVISRSGYVGNQRGSSGVAVVSGAGSAWINTDNFQIGGFGIGSLTIKAGGQVSDRSGQMGFNTGAVGTAIVSGPGSTWTNSDSLRVGSSGSAELTVADGGKVTTGGLLINSLSSVRLHVSGDDMLMLSNLGNGGTISFFADALLPAGVYRPISAYPGRTILWYGPGSYPAFGGIWDNTAKTFTVAEPTALSAGDVETVTSGERMMFTDILTGRQVGASFGAITGSVSFSAAPMGGDELASLAGLLEEGDGVLSAWDFTTSLSGGEVMLSFDVGLDREGLAVWHLEDGVWSAYTPGLLTYDGNGIASFTVNSFSGYAVTAAVPEPGTLGLMALASAMLLARRRK